MMNNNFDVKKMAEIEGIDLGDTSKLSMEQLETISGGSDYADEIINSFGSAFAMLLAAGQIIQTIPALLYFTHLFLLRELQRQRSNRHRDSICRLT